MTGIITNDLNLLRSILRSADDLQIHSFGDLIEICIKLDDDIHINLFISTSTNSLIINNIHDIRIYKLSNPSSLEEEQWRNIRDYFNELIQQSDSNNSLYLIIRLIQEYILLISKLNWKSNDKKMRSVSNGDASIQTFREANFISNRITYDPTIDRSQVITGHEDRSPGEGITDYQMKKLESETIDTVESKSNRMQGLYRFDQPTNQWILCSDARSLAFDDFKSPSIDQTCIPDRCQFTTWNILSGSHQSEFLYTNQRYTEIFKTLKSLLSDIICLQEVTEQFLNLLLNERWLKDNNYYLIIMGSIFDKYEGQLMLMKNFQPRAFDICSFDLLDHRKNEYIIARFGLNDKVTIDLINLHLTNSIEQHSRDLEYLLKRMKTQNYMIMGDFNFGDEDIIEETILQKSKYQIHDLWKDIYDIEENPGYTFDPTRNLCAQITSDSSIRLRSDRYLLHRLPNLFYSIEHLDIIAQETIQINSRNNKRIHQSDHYALQLILHFQIRSISHHSALVLIPTKNPLFNQQQPGYIHLFCPFFDLTGTEDEEEDILLPLRLLLTQYEPFNLEIDSLMKLNQPSIKYVEQLREQIQQLFTQCEFNSEINYNQLKSSLSKIDYVYILQQSSHDDRASFQITYQIPLGSVLEPVGLNKCAYISNELGEFFNQMNLYPSEQLFEQKREKFSRLLTCFDGIFNQNTSHCFTYTCLPYGSFRLGLHGEDLDVVFVLSEEQSKKNKTNLDQILLQLKHDSSALHSHLINVLETQIVTDFNQEIIACRKIEALFPIISILFNDQTRVEIFVQVIFNEQYEEKRNLLANVHEPIHGVHDIERLIPYVRFPTIFQHLLTFIRTWAQNVGLYGQVYGYLGGYSWAVLCAYICHKYLPSNNSPFTAEQFFSLVGKFFSTYSHFNWSSESLCLYRSHPSIDNRGSMRIICPSPPFNNTSRSTINSTRYLLIQGFQKASGKTCEEILQFSSEFPDQTIQSILQLTLSSQTINELHQWLGYMKSRLAHFLTDCEDECHLFVQTDHQIARGKQSLERFFAIGFQLNEQILSRHREFYYCLNRFLDQFKICLFRSETMKISYKLMSRYEWNIERRERE